MRATKVFIILLSLLVLGGCDHSRIRTDLAARQYFLGDYRSAYREALKAARAGDPQAQYALGYMYYYGKGVIADDNQARKWFRAASLQGHPHAKKALRIMGKRK